MTAGASARPASPLRALVDPWPQLGAGTAAALAAAAVVLGLAASRAGVRFDGALDLHVAPAAPVPLAAALADQAAAVLAPAVVAWAALRTAARRPPFARCAALLAAARLPLVASAPLALLLARALPPERVAAMAASGAPATPGAEVVALALGAVALFAWYVALAATALREAGGLRGGRLAGAAAATLLGGELLSKLALALLG